MEKKTLTNGKIESIFGPMYAGKTSELLKRILWLKHQNLDILVIKPKVDNRYSDDEIVTHTGHRFPCLYTNKLMDLLEVIPVLNRQLSKVLLQHTVFIDEVQFFELDDLKLFVKKLQSNGINIVAAGLDQDSSGIPFESSAYILALSDDVTKIKSYCSVCGQPATKTFKINNSGNRVEVASIGVYEPRCLEHWNPVT
jgi:thymidine kinase